MDIFRNHFGSRTVAVRRSRPIQDISSTGASQPGGVCRCIQHFQQQRCSSAGSPRLHLHISDCRNMSLRVAPDRKAYSRQEFVNYYGEERGLRIWESCQVVEVPEAVLLRWSCVAQEKETEAKKEYGFDKCQLCGQSIPPQRVLNILEGRPLIADTFWQCIDCGTWGPWMPETSEDEKKIMPPDTHELRCEYCFMDWEEEKRAKRMRIPDPQDSDHDPDP